MLRPERAPRLVVEHHVSRLPGEFATLGEQPSPGGGRFGPRCPRVAALERDRQSAQPERVRIRIVVEVGDDLAGRLVHADVARIAEAAVLLAVHDAERELARDLGTLIRRSIDDDDDFEVGVIEARDSFEAFTQRARAVVGADDHRHARPVAIVDSGGERVAHRDERGFRRAVTTHQPEVPVVEVDAAAILVRHAEHETCPRTRPRCR